LKMIQFLDTMGKYLLHSDVAGKPLVAYFMITKDCNMHCRICSYWKGIYKSEVTTKEAKVIIEKLADAGVQILSITGGEPLMRKDMGEILNFAKRKVGVPYVRLQTNGTLLNEEMIRCCILCTDDLWISIDGIGKVHDIIRGREGSFKKIEENVMLLNKMRNDSPPPNLIINTVTNRYNYFQLDEIKQLAEEWKAQRIFFHKVANVKDELYHTKQFSSEEDIGEKIYYPDRKGCLLLYTNVMVNPEGFMIPCGILDKIPVGNLLDDGFEDIWNGRAMRQVRRMVWRGLEVCKRCCVPNTTLRSRLTDTFNLGRLFH